MKPETAFKQFQTTVNADPGQLAIARSRRDAFSAALGNEEDVEEVIVGGSLRRGTQRAPVNDVDIYAVFSSEDHEDWGTAGGSAHNAIEHAAARIAALLGKDGTHVHLLDDDDGTGTYVRLKGRRRHSVKCFIDDPGDGIGLTVDVVPAIRHHTSGLLIPERNLDDADEGDWIRTDPEHLIAAVAARQQAWSLWVPTVRMLKHWSDRVGTGMSSLYVEVLALKSLPTDAARTEALQRFFTSAVWSATAYLDDPAGLCGPIQPDLDVDAVEDALSQAAALSEQALTAEQNEHFDDAVCAWHELFGTEFPEPPGGCSRDKTGLAGTVPAVVGSTYVKPRPVKQSPQG